MGQEEDEDQRRAFEHIRVADRYALDDLLPEDSEDAEDEHRCCDEEEVGQGEE